MTTDSQRPIRVLHIVGGMAHGGIETGLMHILRHVDRDRFHMDFMVHTATPCPYDEEVRALGGRIIPCLHHARPWSYARTFRRILRDCGPYEIVHSHVHHYSGVTLRLAQRAGVPVRIAHSHSDVLPGDASANALRRLYLAAGKRWIRRHATIGLACSGKAADALFGKGWRSDARCRVLSYGIDLEPFRAAADRSVRPELGLPIDAFVIGHVGRFEEPKNHHFLLEIVRRVVDAEPRTRLLLVGAGSLGSEIERRAAELGLARHVVFAGLRSDVPRVLRSAVDVFVMPSFCEGLGLAALEAQSAGVPAVLADTIPSETDVVMPLVTRLLLSEPAQAWAETVLAEHRKGRALSAEQAFAAMEASPFNIRRSVKELERLYAAAASANGN